MVWRFSLHAAPNGAGYIRNLGAINMLLLRSKSFGTNGARASVPPPEQELRYQRSKSFGTNYDDFSSKAGSYQKARLETQHAGVSA